MFKKILVANRGEIAVRIIRACKELNIPIVAEFVENEEVNSYLCSQNIEYLQGYYIGKPSPEVNRLLN